jgi:hypothetical protein
VTTHLENGKLNMLTHDQFSTKADTTKNITILKEDYVNEVIFFHTDDLDVKYLVLLHNLLKNIESSLKKMTQTWDYEPVLDDGYAALHKAVKTWMDFPIHRQVLPPTLYPVVKALAYLPLTDEEIKTNRHKIPPEGLYFSQTDMGGVVGPPCTTPVDYGISSDPSPLLTHRASAHVRRLLPYTYRLARCKRYYGRGMSSARL